MKKLKSEDATPYQFDRVAPADDDAIIERALRILADRLAARKPKSDPLASPNETRDYLRLKYATVEREIFSVLWVDNRHRVLKHEELFFGTVNSATVHPREIVKSALACNAAAVVLAHNHPSGAPEPSQADRAITREITAALKLIDVRVLDHMIVATDTITSFAERGLL